MTDRYEVVVPHRDPGERLDVATVLDLDSAARRAGVDREARAVFREVAFAALLGDDEVATVGDLVARVAAATPGERRGIVNEARERAGLERLDDLEHREHFESLQAALPRGFEGSASCAAEGCTTLPTAPDGRLIRVQARKWWCKAHDHMAGPDDHEPPPGPRVKPHTMGLRPSPEVEAQLAAEDRRQRELARRRRDARTAEVAEIQTAAHHAAATRRPAGWAPTTGEPDAA